MSDEQRQLNAFALEEYRALRTEIDYLGKRSELAQYTAILANAALLSLVFLGASVKAAGMEVSAQLEAVTELDFEIVIILLLFNIVMGLRTIFMERHIDKIGGYIKEVETLAYRDAGENDLGWENYQRRSSKPIKGSFSEWQRQWGVWLSLSVLNMLALLRVCGVI